MKQKNLAIALSLFMIIMVLSGCTITGRAVGVPDERIKIGGLFGQTGFAAFAGEASRNGFVMAIEDFEKATGEEVTFVIENYESDFAKTATTMNKLLDVDDIEVIIGPEWEFSTVAVPIAEEKGALVISPWFTLENAINSPNYFTATPSHRHRIRAMVEEMVSEQVKTVALISTNNPWSDNNANIFTEEAAKKGIQVVTDFKVEMDDKDYRTQITKIKQVSPDAVYAVHATDQASGLFAKQMKEMNVDVQQYVPLARAASNVFKENFADAVKGIKSSAPDAYKNADAFAVKYKARYGSNPTAPSAATAYDMTLLVLNTMNQGKTSPTEISQELINLNGYEGYSNFIKFNAGRQIVSEEASVFTI